MNESLRRRTILGSAMAIFVILIMTITAFAGAVENGSITTDTTAVVSAPDSPGVLDDGGLEQVEMPDSSDVKYTDEGFAADLDSSAEERPADQILNGEHDGQSAIDGAIQDSFEISTKDFNGYKSNLDQAVMSYVNANDPNVAEIGNSGQGSGFTSNLYDTVNAYLNKDKDGYASLTEQLSAQGFTPDREDVSKRTESSKTFSNGDGTYTAILNQKPIHYQDENGDWQDIELTLRTMPDGSFGVMKNTLKSFFGADSSVATVDIDGNSWFKWTPYEQRYIDAYGISHSLSSAQGAVGKVDDNAILYENTFTDTNEEYFVQGDHVKHNMILSKFPGSAQNGMFLSYVGKVELADGLALYIAGNKIVSNVETNGMIEVRNANNEIVYTLEAPFSFEYDDMTEAAFGSYRIEFVGDEIYLSLLTPIEWLIDADRVYPVVIDPTISVDIDVGQCGYSYNYYRYYQRKSDGYKYNIYNYYYLYYPGYAAYRQYYTYIGAYGYSSSYSTYYYNRTYVRRAYFEWETTAVPDTNTVKQIDFHGKQFRTYSFPSSPTYKNTVTIRNFTLDPDDYHYSSSSQTQKKFFFESLAKGSIFNNSVDFGLGYDIDVDVYALGGTAVSVMQSLLPKNVFRMSMHRSEEFPVAKPGYGYFYTYRSGNADNAQLHVLYDPCPQAPDADTGGPYMLPEGTNGVYLDATKSVVCGTSATYKWDLYADGTWDITATTPKTLWNKAFPDDWGPIKIKLQIKDLTYGLTGEDSTTFEIYNVNPEIVTPATPITGTEGQTLIIPRIEFTDPGADTWKYYYDMDGDGKIDFSGVPTTVAGKHYVPSVKWYFCDDADYVNLTIEDDDNGYSDDIEQEELQSDYSGYIQKYKRDAYGSPYYYKYMRYSGYTYMYVRMYSYPTSYDLEYRGLTKFYVPSTVPSTFKPTKVTMRTYIYQSVIGGKVAFNDLSSDPYSSSAQNAWTDAGSSNILDTGNYIDITDSMDNQYINVELDPANFITERGKHSSWYGVGLSRYDPTDNDIYIYFRGGTYTRLTITDGTKTYTLSSAYSGARGAHGYAYKRTYPARDLTERYDTSTINYVRNNLASYNADYQQRTFLKFPKPLTDTSKILGADLRVYTYFYDYYGPIKVGVADLDSDPETATDQAVYDDIASSNILDGATEWKPDLTGSHTIALDDADVISKYGAHSDWYGVGMRMIPKTSNNYLYVYSDSYPTDSYKPVLLVDYRVPFKLPVDVKNLDPVLDTSKMVVTPSVAKEGEEVSVSGITYTDGGPCDTHMYRVINIYDPKEPPAIVKDWTPVSGGKLDFKFFAADDDPEDADADISKDKIQLIIQLKDDDYVAPGGDTMIVPNAATTPNSGGNTIPWGPGFGTRRYQQYYGKSQLGGNAEDFIGWGFRYYQSSTWSITYYNLKIYLSHKSTTGLSSTFANNYGTDRTLVMNRASYTWVKSKVGQDFTMMTFDNTFKYNGKDNIVMEVSYTSGSPNSVYYFNTYSTPDLARLWASSPTATTGSIGTNYGLVTAFEFNPKPESGIANTTIEIMVHNVAPELDTSGMKFALPDGTIVDRVEEGQEFDLVNITFKDPALLAPTEVFEYRVDLGDGVFSPWANVPFKTGGDSEVVPNAYEDPSSTNSGNTIPLGPAFGTRRYMQWYDGSMFSGGGPIVGMGFREYLGGTFDITYNNLRVYLSHTTATSLSTTYANNYGSDRTLVLSKSAYNYKKTASGDEFEVFNFDTQFNYDGVRNLVWEFTYDSGTSVYRYFDAVYDSGMHRQYATSPTATTGTVHSGYGLVTQFVMKPPDELFAVIPGIRLQYPDDHPTTGTSSDVMSIKLEIRDDDGGTDSGDADITVENVAPEIKKGKILIDGVEYKGSGDSIIVPNAATTPNSGGNTIPWGPGFGTRRYMQYYRNVEFGGTARKIDSIGFRYYQTSMWSITYNNLKIYLSHKSTTGLSSVFANNYGTQRTLVMDRSSYTWIKDVPGQPFTMIDLDTPFYYDGTSHVVMEVSYTSGSPNSNYFFNTYSTSSLWRLYATSPTATSGSVGSNYGLVTMFASSENFDVEMNEGQMMELQDWDIEDPAESEPTEFLEFMVEWGDGEVGPRTNATSLGGINMKPSSGPNIIVPNDHSVASPGNSDNTIPWGPGFGTRRYMQWYDGDQMGGAARDVTSLGFLYRRGTLPTITYSNIKIYLSHLKTDSWSSTFANNYGTGRTLVFAKTSWSWTTVSATPAFMTIPLDTNFKYNGADNVVMEVVYTTGSPSSTYFWNADSGSGVMKRLWASSPTATSGSTSSDYGLITQFGFKPITLPPSPQPWQSFSHRYRDNGMFTATIHTYDDDLGHDTYEMIVKVNNINPVITPRYVMPQIIGFESGSPSVQLPQVPFEDPATQYDPTDPNELWTYWWDIDNNGQMNNAPDVVGKVPQSLVTEVLNESYGRTPSVKATVNDDFLNQPVALYIFDDDMTLDPSAGPDGTKGTISVYNVAPVASIDAYMPVEVRVRMSGTRENDLKVELLQVNPQNPRDVLASEMTIERQPGQPKDNPFADGKPSAPLPVKLKMDRTIQLRVTFDGTPDPNDVFTQSGPNGADPTYVYLDFPENPNYDPRDDDQSSTGHHWTEEYKFNVNDGVVQQETRDVTEAMRDQWGFLVGTSTDDSSDDAMFNWVVLSGASNVPLTYSRITYYNDGSPAVINGAFKDVYPSAFAGTAPVTYEDKIPFIYAGPFSVALQVTDDDKGFSNIATYSLS
jgi:hypothetical protein